MRITQAKEIIAAYAAMAEEHIHYGFEATLVSLMFNQLDPSLGPIAEQQTREIETVYGRLLTHFVRRPNRPGRFQPLPRWIVAPDYPVPKRGKDHLRDLRVNGGLHHHALALTLGRDRKGRTLTDLIDEEQGRISGAHRPLWRVHAKPIKDRCDYVVEYVCKSVLRGRVGVDSIFVLPRVQGELSRGEQ